MKKRIILFDIDRTIFDTDKLLRLQSENISKVVNAERFKEFWDSTLSGEKHITSEERLNLICSKFNIKNSKLLSNIFFGKEYKYIYSDSVYLETRVVFDKLKSKYRLGIYSEGTAKFQNHKFRSLGLDRYFDNDLIFIVDAKDTKEVLNKIPKDAIIVDDKETICGFLTKNDIRAIWLNRKDNRKSDKFETIYSLFDLLDVL
ncbi:MAG: hypothetical protein UR39_C0003G0061 [Candidatus Woesebacteria bacterium GW2011_GWA1_33_30]|uniref:Uncharacterized protein n=1 Tax=Candidatus Woesebacteria bacterium GW2011_GWA2_33_28 TaxID=1618561 RepID=A0A0F9ZTR3_9BACT|nr:MAG: hypothetical protein UR38_C0003G0064 [Candidatus Woesebacteria bacterium GW2011_GWA2_33_28]KKP48526.1 MAG: hypothetical protein UR39_C0003G0061 [Candidatus Woesebacteria bacterium GW2011_GWA1_33_30]KKP49665.1 MAG: hypothetical protein UR40_C0004G0064 [Microgenomates group bacterium GW2011_GWC1_33_32]KKP52282.1 MAG: hypothetical protein UR44_C0003G0064 [Candidatus Woesebacteria bacterium GW2011_GWB1_33_38]KKP58113.1 MAG: hypothetical protein UR48_C0007G0003 [Microgenomates group bacteriu